MKRLAAALFLSLCALPAWCGDLLDIYRQALAYDASFAAARAERDAGLEKVVQGRAGLLPNVGLSGYSTWNEVDVHTTLPHQERNYNTRGYTVQLTQPLFRWQNWIQYRQGELQGALAEVRFGLARQDLMLRVADAYFNVLNAQDALEAVIQLRTAAAEQLEIAKTSFEVGTVTITDVYEAQSRHDLAVAQEIAADNELTVRREALAVIVGAEPGKLTPLRPGVELLRPQPENIGEWVDAAELGSYGVQAQQLAREIAAREVQRNRAGHYPTLDVVATRGRANSGYYTQGVPGGSRTESSTIGVQLNVPLYAGGGISSSEREAAALKIKADADLEAARRAAALSAREAFLGVTSGLAQVIALEAAQVSSASALEANRLGYEVGVRINIDVLNAQSQLADTRQSLARARYDTLLAQLRLKAAAGTLDEEDLERVNALLGEAD